MYDIVCYISAVFYVILKIEIIGDIMRISALFILFLIIHTPAFSQQNTYSAGNMWGTSPAGVSVPGALDSSVLHANNGVVAGQVNSSLRGTLETDGTASNIYSIGSQVIVSNAINGNDNKVDLDADQNANNSGDVENKGNIANQNRTDSRD